MPKVSILNTAPSNAPTAERIAHTQEGVDQTSGTRAYRVRNPLEIHKAHFSPALVEAAARYLKNREAVETAAKMTGQYDGTVRPKPKGGVRDEDRVEISELQFVHAKMEDEFMDLIELLVVGVEAHRHNQPKTVGDIARRVLAYGPKNNDQNTAAGVGMLWGALTRLASLYIELRAGQRKFSTAEEIAYRIQERRRQAETAKAMFDRENEAA
jgi:hypothetical protein